MTQKPLAIGAHGLWVITNVITEVEKVIRRRRRPAGTACENHADGASCCVCFLVYWHALQSSGLGLAHEGRHVEIVVAVIVEVTATTLRGAGETVLIIAAAAVVLTAEAIRGGK